MIPEKGDVDVKDIALSNALTGFAYCFVHELRMTSNLYIFAISPPSCTAAYTTLNGDLVLSFLTLSVSLEPCFILSVNAAV